jgi:hypothetical protein
LAVLPSSEGLGGVHHFDRVKLLQDDEAKPDGGRFCCWMPYQTGQAAKYEQGGGAFEQLKARVAALEAQLCQQNQKPSDDCLMPSSVTPG